MRNLRRPLGRPSKLTAQRFTRLVAAVAVGATYRQACDFAGIEYRTLRRWLVRGAQDEAPPEFREFCHAIKKAEATAVLRCLERINAAAASGVWQAAAWLLERRYPDAYGRRVLDHRRDPREALAKLLGVDAADLPEPTAV
jgi:hypothetical protein